MGVTLDPQRLLDVAQRAGVVGPMRVYANMLAPHNIRVNSIHPPAVRTLKIDNEFIRRVQRSLASPGRHGQRAAGAVRESRISATRWSGCSDAARSVTGVTLPVDFLPSSISG
jgi:NAD(P)-dependent dehydrogenase (short-subunit alcohol dehydrogenase family)